MRRGGLERPTWTVGDRKSGDTLSSSWKDRYYSEEWIPYSFFLIGFKLRGAIANLQKASGSLDLPRLTEILKKNCNPSFASSPLQVDSIRSVCLPNAKPPAHQSLLLRQFVLSWLFLGDSGAYSHRSSVQCGLFIVFKSGKKSRGKGMIACSDAKRCVFRYQTSRPSDQNRYYIERDNAASHFRSNDIVNSVNWWEAQILFLPNSGGYSASTKTKPSFIFISCPCSWSTEISYFLATFLIYSFSQQVPKPKHQRIQIPKHPSRPARPAQPTPMYSVLRARQHFGVVDSPLFFEDF